MTLATLDEYKEFADISGEKTNDKISTLLEVSSAVILAYCGITIGDESSPVTVYTEEGKTGYYLDTLGSAPTVTYTHRLAIDELEAGTIVDLVEGTDFFYIDGELRLQTVSPLDYDVITATFTTTSVPSTLKQATILLTQYYYKGEYNKTGSTAGGSQIDYTESSNIPNHVKTLLNFHRVL